MTSRGYKIASSTSIRRAADLSLVLALPQAEVRFDGCPEGVAGALSHMLNQPVSEESLVDMVVARDGAEALSLLHLALAELADELQLLNVTTASGRHVTTVTPLSKRFNFTALRPDPYQPYVLSRFALMRRVADQLAMESPTSECRLTFHDDAGARVAARLARPCRLVDWRDEDGSREMAEAILTDLLNASMLEDGETGESVWEFHDLLFHSRTRQGRHDGVYGRHARFPDLKGPLVKPPMSDVFIALPNGSVDDAAAESLFREVVDRRCSTRSHAETPLSAAQLGEFLFRSARIRDVVRAKEGDLSRRPYPGAGGAYELEIYPVVHHCHGVPTGMYHYCPLNHRLERLAVTSTDVAALLSSAAGITNAGTPQVLFVISARFSRLMWRYSSIGYSLILKNVGCLYQTMYLTAAAMGLAACAVGGGDSDLFARATGIDYLDEGAVGEFILGRKDV